MKKIIVTIAAVVVVTGIAVMVYIQPAKPPQQQAFINGTVLTMDADNSVAQAVVLEGDKIVAVGSNQKIKPYLNSDTVIHDLDGKTLLPGFIDAHGHFPGSGLRVLAVDLNSPPIGIIKDIPQLIAALKSFAENVEEGEWVYGFGFDDTIVTEKRHVTIQELDAAFPNNPVFVWHISGHMAIVNSMALDIINVDKNTPNLDGGVYVKDENGELTGLLEENATLAAQTLAMDISAMEVLTMLEDAVHEYARQGVTSAQSGAVEEKMASGLVLADKLNLIPMRLSLWPIFDQMGPKLLSGELNKEDFVGNKSELGAIKIIADGSIQGYTGYLSQPYHVQPAMSEPHGDSAKGEGDFRGYPRVGKAELIDWVSQYHKAGYQMAIHGNGDASIDDIIEAFTLAQQEMPKADPRLILIHSQMARDDQLVKMKELGITPSFFTAHTYYWGDRHRDIFMGPERAARMSPTKSALDIDLPFTIHLDTPVVPMSPLLGVWATANRMTTSGKVIGPEQRISVTEALRAVTINAAWQMFKEDELGSIEAGKLADLVVLDKNPLDNAMSIKDINVVQTMVGGVTIYQQ